jgi:hypothetical protein
MLNYVDTNLVPLLIGSAFTCGVVIFYVVMIRTIRRRQELAAANG